MTESIDVKKLKAEIEGKKKVYEKTNNLYIRKQC